MTPVILVLDDEPWQLIWVETIAKAAGGRCFFAHTYDEAVSAFEKDRPNIAIIDVRIGDASVPAKGATLEAADPSWVGLRFLRYLRVDQRSSVTAFVYTGLDREQLSYIVENAFSASFYTKFESSYFRAALEKEVARLLKLA